MYMRRTSREIDSSRRRAKSACESERQPTEFETRTRISAQIAPEQLLKADSQSYGIAATTQSLPSAATNLPVTMAVPRSFATSTNQQNFGFGYSNGCSAETYTSTAQQTEAFACEVSPPTPSTQGMRESGLMGYPSMMGYESENLRPLSSLQYHEPTTMSPPTTHISTRPSSMPESLMLYGAGALQQQIENQQWAPGPQFAQIHKTQIDQSMNGAGNLSDPLSSSAYPDNLPDLSGFHLSSIEGQMPGLPYQPSPQVPHLATPESIKSQLGGSVSPKFSNSPSPSMTMRESDVRSRPQCWDHGCNGRTFSTFSNLLRHQREKAGISVKSECPFCGAAFTRSTARNGHLERGRCKARRELQD